MCPGHVVIRQTMDNDLRMSCREVDRFGYKLYAPALIRIEAKMGLSGVGYTVFLYYRYISGFSAGAWCRGNTNI